MMAARPAPRPKSKSGGNRPAGKHSVTGNRNYRRLVETKQNDATGTGTGSSVHTP